MLTTTSIHNYAGLKRYGAIGASLKVRACNEKSDLITDKYDSSLPRADAVVAVKIVDMFGEEVLVAK